MNARQALGRGGFAAAACVGCCAPPIIAALGLTAGLAVTAGIFLGLAVAITVILIGGSWIVRRSRARCGRRTGPVLMADPVARRVDEAGVRSLWS